MKIANWVRGPLLLAATAWPGLALAQPAETGPIGLNEALARAGALETGDAMATERLLPAAARRDAADALVEQARIGPRLEMGLEVENFAGTGPYGGLSASEYTLSAGRRIELGGKRQARLAVANAGVDLAELEMRAARADLALLVRQRYVAATAAQERFELAEDVLTRNRELARIARVMVDVGREPPLRSLRAEAALAKAEAEREAARGTALAAPRALAVLWNSDEAALVPAETVGIPAPDSAFDPSALSLAQARREADLAQAEVANQCALGRSDPTVSLGVRRFAESRGTAVLAGISMPLGLKNANRGNIAASQARALAAMAEARIAEADLRQDYFAARTEYDAARLRATTLREQSLPSAQEALDLVERGYRAGRFDLTEVLLAAEARDAIREDLIAAEEARALAAARLIRLTAQ